MLRAVGVMGVCDAGVRVRVGAFKVFGFGCAFNAHCVLAVVVCVWTLLGCVSGGEGSETRRTVA